MYCDLPAERMTTFFSSCKAWTDGVLVIKAREVDDFYYLQWSQFYISVSTYRGEIRHEAGETLKFSILDYPANVS